MINYLKHATAFIITFFLLSSPLMGQADSTADTLSYTLELIEVKATHSSISFEKVPRALTQKNRSIDEINSASALTLDKLTYDLPGVWVSNRHNYALGQRMLIRGIGWRSAFGIRGIQVILDGIPLTTADGQTVTNLLDPAFVRDMDILRGPASTFWGNSSGGVVYLSTRPSYANAPALRVRGMAGSYGLRKTELEIAQQWNKNQMHLFGSYFQQDGFRDHSEARIGRIGLTSRLHIDEQSSLQIFGAYASMPKAENPSTLDKQHAAEQPRDAYGYFASNNAREKANQGQVGASYYRQLPFGTLTITGYGIYRDLVSPLPFAYINLDRLMGGTRVMIEQDRERLSWKAGIEGKYQRDDRINRDMIESQIPDTLILDQRETVTNLSAFGLLQYNLAENLDISTGLRYDRLKFKADDRLIVDGDQSGSRTFHTWSPSVGLSYEMGDHRWFTNASTAFEAPTTTELVNRPGGGGGFNPSIEPEHTVSLETGFKGKLTGTHLNYELTGYQMWIRDILLPFQTPNSDRVYYRNEGKTRHSGLEFMLKYSPHSNLQTSISYNYIYARFINARTSDGTEVDNKAIPGIPDHRATATLGWFPGDFIFHLDAQWVDSYPVNSINTFYNDDYLILNTRVSHRGISMGKELSLTPFIEVDNLANVRYNSSVTVNANSNRYYEPAPGRHWVAGIALEFK